MYIVHVYALYACTSLRIPRYLQHNAHLNNITNRSMSTAALDRNKRCYIDCLLLAIDEPRIMHTHMHPFREIETHYLVSIHLHFQHGCHNC